MAGQSSNLGASSSSRARKQNGTKRKQNATQDDEPKKQRRHSQLIATAPHPNAGAAAVPVLPLHYTASRSAAMAVTTLPVAGVNGAALRWNTAATLDAATTRAPVWSLPVAAGQLVSVQLPLISYDQAMAGGVSSSPAPAMAEALANIKSDTLGRLLSAVMRTCNPPQLQSWTGAPPPWWPAAPAAEDMADLTPVPFAPPYKLRKEEKVAVLVAIVKHHAPDLAVFSTDAMCERAKLSNDPEAANWWRRALAIEAARHNNVAVPKAPAMVVNLIMAPPLAAGDDHLPAATAAADPATEDGGGANGGEQGVMLAGDSVTELGDDGGHGLGVAAAEPEQKQEELSDGVLDGGAMAGDFDVDRPVNFLGDDFASADMDQLLDDMLAPFQMQQLEEAHQAIDAEAEAPGAAAAVEEEEAAQEGGPWYMEEHMTNFFEDFEPLKDENGKNYLD